MSDRSNLHQPEKNVSQRQQSSTSSPGIKSASAVNIEVLWGPPTNEVWRVFVQF
jgi:hypothetical protein